MKFCGVEARMEQHKQQDAKVANDQVDGTVIQILWSEAFQCRWACQQQVPYETKMKYGDS